MPVDVLEFGHDLVAAMPSLQAHARKLTRDADAAGELVQDTLARAWRFRDRFTPGTNIRAWLNTILRNQHLAKLRRSSLERRYFTDAPWADVALGPGQEAALMLIELKSALRNLPEKDCSAVALIAGRGLSYEAAARSLGCPIGTVKSRLSRARQKLSRALDGGDPAGAPGQDQPPAS